MKVLFTYPPNFAEINRAFNTRGKAVIYAYGDVVHNPSRIHVSEHLIVHEKVHLQRQYGDPANWWTRYIDDPEFRLEEEILAHAAEYQHFQRCISSGAHLENTLHMIAERLSSPLYGNMIGLDEAKRLIGHAGQRASR